MLGAKEMKHVQDEPDEEDKIEKKGPKDKKQHKKKGIEKYIDDKAQGDETIINTDKVLFLKDKTQQEEKE
jgi:hypothetical protein